LIYHCHLQRTAEQIEDDSANGIVERLTRTLTLDPAGKKISFEFNYYYEVEGPGYVLEICFKNDTKFQGTYEQQGDKIVVTITGGSQNATVISSIYRTMWQSRRSLAPIKSRVMRNFCKMEQDSRL
jgi:UDP-N-acetylglucosamine:LPS N-acetylglucosamine transferase